MKRSYLIFTVALAVAALVSLGWAQPGSTAGPTK